MDKRGNRTNEFECRNSYHNCRDLVETTDRACLIPSYQWTCPEDCGVCRARCKDFFAGCFDSSSLCLQSHMQKHCPKSCASCDECEDIISPRLCEQYRGRCKTDISVIYACRETCGLCDDDCNDAFVQESMCTIFESRGTNSDPSLYTTLQEQQSAMEALISVSGSPLNLLEEQVVLLPVDYLDLLRNVAVDKSLDLLSQWFQEHKQTRSGPTNKVFSRTNPETTTKKCPLPKGEF
ncbi:unnamed protein product [Lepeophtheirus salmonis]|uniref:(salmon louse) hypothetical protein n=1 Tax=Lepeophtheirus salmonis TaxID=72036 RepID=A0A7R8CH90_LEPSM|nr:unnamed protein product [Lepeophtheirus salmonis]CAF2822534.1 unnamed protein product [Lepeophtheirus salmonis]